MAASARKAPRTAVRWSQLDDQRLLDVRFCDLRLAIDGGRLETHVRELWLELAARELRLKPHVWLSTEWFSPEGIPGIAIPFYLAHPRLQRLERTMMLEVEGGARDECMAILRHEAGHCAQHAWRLHRRPAWRAMFGDSARAYPEIYRPNPASQRFVQHLRQWYAQAHPDEDFAETFAVWLTPRSAWRRRYADWPALRKLEYVDELMRSLRGQLPPGRSRRRVEPLAEVKRTLREHYADKQAAVARWRPNLQDRDLQRLFAAEPGRRSESAAAFLRRNRGEIRRLVARSTGESAYALARVVDDAIARCEVLDLRAGGDEQRLRVDFALSMAVRTVHFHYSRRNWVAL